MTSISSVMSSTPSNHKHRERKLMQTKPRLPSTMFKSTYNQHLSIFIFYLFTAISNFVSDFPMQILTFENCFWRKIIRKSFTNSVISRLQLVFKINNSLDKKKKVTKKMSQMLKIDFALNFNVKYFCVIC